MKRALHSPSMRKLPVTPVGVSLRGAPLPRVKGRGFRGIRTRKEQSGLVAISGRDARSFPERVLGQFYEATLTGVVICSFLVGISVLSNVLHHAAWFTVPAAVLGTPLFFMGLIRHVVPRFAQRPLLDIQLGHSAWWWTGPGMDAQLLPRGSARSAHLRLGQDGLHEVAVQDHGRPVTTVASQLSGPDAARLVDLLREYGKDP